MDINLAIDFAKAYGNLGWAVQEQLDRLMLDGNGADLNRSAVEAMADLVEPLRAIDPVAADELHVEVENWLDKDAEAAAEAEDNFFANDDELTWEDIPAVRP